MVFVRMLSFWYQMQLMFIKWGQYSSSSFSVSNGVRQGGVLSPLLFSVYIDELSLILNNSNVGCFINDTCVNHVFYADDICLMAPSNSGLQKLVDICHHFSIRTSIIFNPIKSVCAMFKPKSCILPQPDTYIGTSKLN